MPLDAPATMPPSCSQGAPRRWPCPHPSRPHAVHEQKWQCICRWVGTRGLPCTCWKALRCHKCTSRCATKSKSQLHSCLTELRLKSASRSAHHETMMQMASSPPGCTPHRNPSPRRPPPTSLPLLVAQAMPPNNLAFVSASASRHSPCQLRCHLASSRSACRRPCPFSCARGHLFSQPARGRWQRPEHHSLAS